MENDNKPESGLGPDFQSAEFENDVDQIMLEAAAGGESVKLYERLAISMDKAGLLQPRVSELFAKLRNALATHESTVTPNKNKI